MLIIRGTTPTHTFGLPVDSTMCDKVRIIYSQNGKPVIKINSDRLRFSENEVLCKLTREETFSLDCAKPCEIQVRILTIGGDVLASDIIKVGVGRCLDDEVLA